MDDRRALGRLSSSFSLLAAPLALESSLRFDTSSCAQWVTDSLGTIHNAYWIGLAAAGSLSEGLLMWTVMMRL
jgi:hypothetical protein